MQIRALIKEAMVQLRDMGFESPRLEAELLMMHVTKLNQVQLITRDLEELSPLDETVFRALIDERLRGEPIAYILGEREFWDLTLKVSPDTLIPRPDTEVLVEKAITLITCNHFKDVLDLGTGSGAIILALKHTVPEINATAVDISEGALAVAQENAERYHLEVDFRCGSWFTPFLEQAYANEQDEKSGKAAKSAKGSKASTSSSSSSSSSTSTRTSTGKGSDLPNFDLIVANPPYIAQDDPHLQMGDVRFEPLSALVSGIDGLDDIKLIAHESKAFLRDGGYLMFEHGYNQGYAVRRLLSDLGYSSIETLRDLGQNERVTLGCWRHKDKDKDKA